MADAGKETELISVIVPVWNKEKFLRKSVRSICEQTWKNLEILLVDDGSTDSSAALESALAAEDPRIRVICRGNGGPSAARNTGLDQARGKYVFFCDADDCMLPEQLAYLAVHMPPEGLSVCACREIWEADDPAAEREKGAAGALISAAEMQKRLFSLAGLPYQGFLWSKLFCRSVIEKYHLRFAENIWCNEDRLFVFHYLRKVEQVFWSPLGLYAYVSHPDGVLAKSHGRVLDDRMWSEIQAYEEMRTLTDGKAEYLGGLLYDEYFSLHELLRKEMPDSRRAGMKRLEKELLRELLRNPSLSPRQKLTAAVRYWIRGQGSGKSG